MADFINRRDLDFLLYELLQADRLCRYPRYADYDRQAFDAILDTAHAIATEHFAPLAARMDREEPSFDGKTVYIIPEVKQALAVYLQAGFIAAGFDHELGGLQLPQTIAKTVAAIFGAANISLSAYPALTSAAANLLNAHGNAAQKARYLPHLLSGRFFGTMCLSEPQAGSSLSDILTRAVPSERGHYLISGTKMWISCGDHELSENIIHFVLAKVPGGPPGAKGISLFIVPKIRLNADGSLGEGNNVVLAGLNHKMGCRGTSNAMLNFGESGECHGTLVGELHQGLACMFHMMNEVRVGVGLGAAILGYAGYLYSLEYAQTRLQGRHPRDKDPTTPQVALVEHADVKRLLLQQKAYVEGAMALVLYCARLIDERALIEAAERREELDLLMEILTPIAKSWPSEFCLEANKQAIQILGGYGYTRDYPVERLYRDNRLNLIHEGAHAIHGIDILGRKVRMKHGRAFKILVGEIERTIRESQSVPVTAPFAEALQAALRTGVAVTQTLVEHADINRSLANATLYLDALGTLVVAWMWLKQASVAAGAMVNAEGSESDFYEGKLRACKFFFVYELPLAVSRFGVVASLDDTALTMPPEAYAAA